MNDTEQMLVQIEDLKRANKRWKIFAAFAFLVIGAVSGISLERYRAERAAVKRAVEAAERQVELAERQRAEALTIVRQTREAEDAMQQQLLKKSEESVKRKEKAIKQNRNLFQLLKLQSGFVNCSTRHPWCI